MIVWLAMFRVFVFDSAAYATITMYFFRKQVRLGSIRYYYNVFFSVNKGVTLITFNSYVETYRELLMYY